MAVIKIALLSLAVLGWLGHAQELGYSRWDSSGYDDVVFTSDVLFSASSRSRIDCARLCSTTENCITFTFNPLNSGFCRGHSSTVGYSSSNVPEVGAKTFQRDAEGVLASQLHVSCASNADCSAVNSECFAGTCLCTPGYFHSHGSGQCVPSCSAPELHNTYTQYPDRYMAPNMNVYVNLTLEDCKSQCNSNYLCITFDYWYADGTCQLSDQSPLTSPADFLTKSAGGTVDMFQRKCA